MSVVERAARSAHKRSAKKCGELENHKSSPALFHLNASKLAERGFYYPDARSSKLALELRAVKRRLLRRIGYLRKSGERQAFRTPGRQRNLILVTSTRAGEGKTFTAVNLALSLAIEDQIETLLVDADIPRPKVRAQFDLPALPGLADCMLDQSLDGEGLGWRAAEAPFGILPEGANVERAGELFASEASQRFWTRLSTAKRDRLVLIDAPPVLATTEAVMLAKYADEIVFVVEANSTPEPVAAAALDELLDVNPNISLILNRSLIGAGGSHYASYEYYNQRNEGPAAAMPEGQGEGESHGTD